MSIGLQNHGDVLPESFYAAEVCATCEQPSKKLNLDDNCPYCVEQMLMVIEGQGVGDVA